MTGTATFSDKSRKQDIKKYYPGQKMHTPREKINKGKRQTVIQIEKLPASFPAGNGNLLR